MKCNKEHLSKLDGYADQFCAQNRIDSLIKDEKIISFIYDSSLLLRFLLKVTFNCLRYKRQDTEWIRPFSDYILYGVDRPVGLLVKLGIESRVWLVVWSGVRQHQTSLLFLSANTVTKNRSNQTGCSRRAKLGM